MLLFPETITNANRSRLMELAGKTDDYWRPRLTAAIQYRSGDFRKAAEFFDANDPGAPFLFLAAMNDYKLGQQDREATAHRGQCLDSGTTRERPRGRRPASPQWLGLGPLAHVTIRGIRIDRRSRRRVGRSCPSCGTGEAHFQAALARHYDERDNGRWRPQPTKARLLFEQKLVKEPENSTSAAGLADLLSSQNHPAGMRSGRRR